MKTLITIWILAILSLFGIAAIVNYMTAPAGAVVCSGPCSNDKYDGGCQPTDTEGRCADKCPADQYQQGVDKNSGQTVCGQASGCPYGDAIPMDKCDTRAPQVLSAETAVPPVQQPIIYQYYGGK